MTSTLYLAVQYLRFHAARSAIVVLAVALIIAVPAVIHLLLDASERQMTARAASTPLVVGARGSTLDLVLNSLYFTGDRPPLTSVAASEEVWASGLAAAIPLYARFEAQGAPIVGTTLDYFEFRGLEVADGRDLAVLGEAVLGATVARDLGLAPGDSLVSSPENLFDLGGTYPLRMPVVGVLAATGGPDDRAVFVDLKTAWVIEGIGHGHGEAAEADDLLARTERNVVAGPALPTFAEITPENIDSFHFHGSSDSYSVTAVIAVPNDERSGVILRGRYLDREEPLQIVVPQDVVDGLLATMFRIGRLIDTVVATIALAAVLAIALVFYMSLELRRGEIETVFRLGCRRSTILRLIGAEIAILLGAGIVFAAVVVSAIAAGREDLALWLLGSWE
ncbi:ABC transporter permease [Roseitranquillus sediminis]|uniref:ABC transporter permease n=1 Tax=Roseitranquillus sediminis TaxID=2809051 RepID=UPI001D0C5D95|nr:ABC transporter permease [Roseitranquillus sediminis]MBM9596025.1 ABC transporter permease [Roseitranquillus sediminis]